MNDTMLQRLLWKEYRAQRGFWLGVAGIGLVMQLIVLMVTDEIDLRINLLGLRSSMRCVPSQGSARAVER